ncbi:hypothetical protein CVV70_04515 [Ralstonia solanacearum]|nr:hypothetical protein CCY86_18195 [Ralstonia solanacearum]OPK48882.1 hypothetical protein B5G54_09185 [Ralstonia solanacearum]OPK54484.1 hypothetical protein B5J95_13355 [Ralstonia solanacearum]OPK58797.1 hypothetical protein B5S37_06490 [Ralstonia solanacearum]OYQ02294.1 hypothetical protein B7R79_19210 [Ralstonia solanacearum]
MPHGLPSYIFAQRQMRDALGIPHRRVQKRIRFDRNEVMAWAKRWSQDAKNQGIDARADPASQRRSLQQALAALPERRIRAIGFTDPPVHSPCYARRRAISSTRRVPATV